MNSGENDEYLDDEYETEAIVQKRIIKVSKEETIDEYEVELDVSKYPKTKARKRVVAHVSLKN